MSGAVKWASVLATSARLEDAVEEAADGIAAQLGGRSVDLLLAFCAQDYADHFGLTRRELTILTHLVQKETNAEIAKRLYISPKTVDHHVSSVLQKMGVKSRADAAKIAMKEGLFSKTGEC